MRSTAEKQKTAEESKKRGAGPGLGLGLGPGSGNVVQGKLKVVTPLYYVQPAPPPNYLDDDDVEDGDGDGGGIVGIDKNKTTSHSGLGASSTPPFSEDSTNSGLSSPSRLKRGIDGGGGGDDGDASDDDEYVLV